MSKAKEINKLLGRLKAKRLDVKSQMEKIQLVIDKPDAEAFDQVAGDEKIAQALIADAENGGKTFDVVTADVDRDRLQVEAAQQKQHAEKSKATDALLTQNKALSALTSQIATVEAEPSQSLKELASDALEPALQDYAKAADDLFLKLGRVYGISSVFGKNATNRFLLDTITIPSAGTKGFKHYGVFSGIQTAVTTTATHGELLQVESERFMKECLGG